MKKYGIYVQRTYIHKATRTIVEKRVIFWYIDTVWFVNDGAIGNPPMLINNPGTFPADSRILHH